MKQLLVIYAVFILLSAVWLVGIEHVNSGFYFGSGGRDTHFTFYDGTLFLVFFVALGLTYISYKAYNRKRSDRLFFVALAFFLFALKAALKLIDNFWIGSYTYMGISIQTLELIILLSLFYALFKK